MSTFRRGLTAGALAGLLSGIPSTLHALLTGRDPLEATRAAGTLLASPDASTPRLLVAAAVVHTGLSLGWGVVLARTLPRERPLLWGGLAGAGIAALDLGLVGRRLPAIRRLPLLPQVADHLLYGVLVALSLERLERS